MKRMTRKPLNSVLPIGMLLCMLATPAFAAAKENAVQPYGMLCPECNRGEIVLTSSFNTDEVVIEEFDCPRNPAKKDVRVFYTTYSTWACTYCGQGETKATEHREVRCGH